MYNEFATYIKDEDILLSIEDTYSSDVEKLGAEELDEQVQSYAAVNMAEKIKQMADESFVLMRTFMDIDPPEINDEVISANASSFEENPSPQTGPKDATKSKVRESNRRYTLDQIEKIFDLVTEEGKTDHVSPERNCLSPRYS